MQASELKKLELAIFLIQSLTRVLLDTSDWQLSLAVGWGHKLMLVIKVTISTVMGMVLGLRESFTDCVDCVVCVELHLL